MFGTNKNSNEQMPVKSSTTSNSLSVNSLVAGTSIEGVIHAKSDLRVDGFINGNLECEGKLIIGQEGKIEGEINCTNAVIEGRVTGKLRVRELLHIKATAHVDGEIKTGKLLVDPGGILNGSFDMGNQKVKNLSTPEKVKVEVGT